MLFHCFPRSRQGGRLHRALAAWFAPLIVAMLIAGCGSTTTKQAPTATATPVPAPTLVYRTLAVQGGPNSFSGTITATNTQSHATLWQAPQGGLYPGSLAEENGVVYGLANDREVAAYSVKSGKAVWQVSLPGASPYFGSGMVEVHGGVVVAVLSTGNIADVSSLTSTITALDATSGTALWSKTLTGDNIWNAAQISDGTLCVAKISGSFGPSGQPKSTPIALDLHTGATLWQGKALSGYVTSSLQSGGVFYTVVAYSSPTTATNTLVAYQEANGTIAWQGKPEKYISMQLATATANSVFVFLSGRSDELAALNPSNGKELWHQPVGLWVWGQGTSGQATVVAVDANALYVSTAGTYPFNNSGTSSPSSAVQSQVEAHSLTDGSLLWKASLPGLLSPPAVGNGLVYAASGDFDPKTSLPISQGHYTLNALHASDGTVAWTLPLSGQVQYPPLLIQPS